MGHKKLTAMFQRLTQIVVIREGARDGQPKYTMRMKRDQRHATGLVKNRALRPLGLSTTAYRGGSMLHLQYPGHCCRSTPPAGQRALLAQTLLRRAASHHLRDSILPWSCPTLSYTASSKERSLTDGGSPIT
ncbi:hypothetical protein AAFF_G00174090 [Aldrovandia affinis]|uniref:Uncharacterized protein n=1 Tax=Aldrovandia affinis TaxID=143900 RepID=A0AAD7WWC9_9TELE|nr:hypothetical protein AAFF_G00174090 [Aldrovandia affinis]